MATEILSELIPSEGGLYALMDSSYLRGGLFQLESHLDMRAIPTDRRKVGMVCYVKDENTYYRYNRYHEWVEIELLGNVIIDKETGLIFVGDKELCIFIRNRGNFSLDDIYYKDNLVRYASKFYLCTAKTSVSPETTPDKDLNNWVCFSNTSINNINGDIITHVRGDNCNLVMSQYGVDLALTELLNTLEAKITGGVDLSEIWDILYKQYTKATLTVPTTPIEKSNENKDIEISWSVMFNGKTVTPESITLTDNGNPITVDPHKESTTVTISLRENHTFKLTAVYKGAKIEAPAKTISTYLPSYLGILRAADIRNYSDIKTDLVTSLTKYQSYVLTIKDVAMRYNDSFWVCVPEGNPGIYTVDMGLESATSKYGPYKVSIPTKIGSVVYNCYTAGKAAPNTYTFKVK